MWAIKRAFTTDTTPEELAAAIDAATPVIRRTLKECWEVTGGRLRRERAGYAGSIGDTMYVVTKI